MDKNAKKIPTILLEDWQYTIEEIVAANFIGRFGNEKDCCKTMFLLIQLSQWQISNKKRGTTLLPHRSYFPDLALHDFYFVPMNEEGPKRKPLTNMDEVK